MASPYDVIYLLETPDCLTAANHSSSATSPLVIAIATVESLLMVAILLLNGSILAAFARSRKIRSSITNYYLMQLAVADFVLGLFVAMHVAFLLNPHVLCNDYGCLARFCSMMVVCAMSVMSHMAITYDRFVAIATPFQYRSTSSRKRVLLQSGVINTVPVLLFVLVPMLWKDTIEETEHCTMVAIFPHPFLAYITIPLYLIITSVKVILYMTIFHVSRRRLDTFSEISGGGSAALVWQRRSIHRTNVSLAKTGGLVLSIFIICWLPFFILLMIQVYGKVDSDALRWANLATFLLILLQSALNPIVYFHRIPAFRAEIYAMFYPGRARDARRDTQGQVTHRPVTAAVPRKEGNYGNNKSRSGHAQHASIRFPSADDYFWESWRLEVPGSPSHPYSVPGNLDHVQPYPRHTDLKHSNSRHSNSRHADPRHADPRHANLKHSNSRHAAPRHSDPRHADTVQHGDVMSNGSDVINNRKHSIHVQLHQETPEFLHAQTETDDLKYNLRSNNGGDLGQPVKDTQVKEANDSGRKQNFGSVPTWFLFPAKPDLLTQDRYFETYSGWHDNALTFPGGSESSFSRMSVISSGSDDVFLDSKPHSGRNSPVLKHRYPWRQKSNKLVHQKQEGAGNEAVSPSYPRSPCLSTRSPGISSRSPGLSPRSPGLSPRSPGLSPYPHDEILNISNDEVSTTSPETCICLTHGSDVSVNSAQSKLSVESSESGSSEKNAEGRDDQADAQKELILLQQPNWVIYL